MSKFNADREYAALKLRAPDVLANIAAFASTFRNGEEEISIATRYQVERFCVNLALKAQP